MNDRDVIRRERDCAAREARNYRLRAQQAEHGVGDEWLRGYETGWASAYRCAARDAEQRRNRLTFEIGNRT